MPSLKQVFKTNIKLYQEFVENQLNISLGNIKAYPYWAYDILETKRYEDDTLYEHLKDLATDTYYNTRIHFDGTEILAKAGNRGIYYTKSSYLDKNPLQQKKTALHEIYHIALARYAGYQDIHDEKFYESVCDILEESYAEFMSIEAIRELESEKIKTPFYPNEISWFKKELERNRISTPKEITDFVLNYNQEANGMDAFMSFSAFHSTNKPSE